MVLQQAEALHRHRRNPYRRDIRQKTVKRTRRYLASISTVLGSSAWNVRYLFSFIYERGKLMALAMGKSIFMRASQYYKYNSV